MANSEVWDERLSPRKRISVPVEVTVEKQIFSATLLDISQRGMRVQTNQSFPLTVHIKMPDGIKEHKVALVWSRNSEDGIMNYGLQFID